MLYLIHGLLHPQAASLLLLLLENGTLLLEVEQVWPLFVLLGAGPGILLGALLVGALLFLILRAASFLRRHRGGDSSTPRGAGLAGGAPAVGAEQDPGSQRALHTLVHPGVDLHPAVPGCLSEHGGAEHQGAVDAHGAQAGRHRPAALGAHRSREGTRSGRWLEPLHAGAMRGDSQPPGPGPLITPLIGRLRTGSD